MEDEEETEGPNKSDGNKEAATMTDEEEKEEDEVDDKLPGEMGSVGDNDGDSEEVEGGICCFVRKPPKPVEVGAEDGPTTPRKSSMAFRSFSVKTRACC